MDSWYDQLVVHQDQYSFLEETDGVVQNLPFFSIFSNTGTYIWLMILASAFFVSTKRKIAGQFKQESSRYAKEKYY